MTSIKVDLKKGSMCGNYSRRSWKISLVRPSQRVKFRI